MNNIYIFDTSALVEFYSERTDYHKNLIEKMKKLETYIPEIVKEEIAGKYKNQIETEDFKSESILDNSSFYDYKESLNQLIKRLKIYQLDTSEVDKTLEVINDIDNKKITKGYKDFAKKQKEDREEYLREVNYPCTIIEYPLLDRLNNLENAQLRFENKIPPGYRDNSKGDSLNKYNDYYIWDSILKYFKDKKIDKDKKIYFVTNDFKDTRKNSRDEEHMKREFFETACHDIELINSQEFLNIIGLETVEIKAYEDMLKQVLEEYFNDESKYNDFIYNNARYSDYKEVSIGDVIVKMEEASGKITLSDLIKFQISVSVMVNFSYTTTHGEKGSASIALNYNVDYEYNEKINKGAYVKEEYVRKEVSYDNIDYIDYEEKLDSSKSDAIMDEYQRKLSLLVNDIHTENTKELQSVLLQNIGIEDTLKKYSDFWLSTVGDTLKNSSDLWQSTVGDTLKNSSGLWQSTVEDALKNSSDLWQSIEDTLKNSSDLLQNSGIEDTLKNSSDLLQNMLIINNFEKPLKSIPIHGVEGLEVPLKDLDMEVNNPEIDDKH